MIETLSKRIWGHPEFHSDVETLISHHLRRSLLLDGDLNGVSAISLHRLLQSASHLSASQGREHRDIAFRIAAASLRCFADEYPGIKALTSVILSRLGNFPARDFMHNGNQPATVPVRIWLENAAHEAANSVVVSPNVQLTLTDFQISLWNDLHSAKCVVVSAPTSSGKSFALQNSLIHQFYAGTASFCVYLVPTRALITQVSESLVAYAMQAGLEDIEILTVPLFEPDAGKRASRTLYVLTQERFQILLDSHPTLSVDILVIDEAQMIGDDSRGVILHTVIDRILRTNLKAHVHFGSPNTKNPEIFPRLFQIADPVVVQSRESPVVQNLIVLRTDAIFRNRVTAGHILNDKERLIGTVNLEAEMVGFEQTLARIAHHFSFGNASLVYANGPAECEQIASLLISITMEAADQQPPQVAPECAEFAKFLRDHFHKEYILADAISTGIAFHYGNMPAVIRKGIETLFETGKLSFLVCTSTLLQGVNLPARNLFISNPQKGSDPITRKAKTISSTDFWNLAGRAGRLKKDFEGNVFLIDLQKWENDPTQGERAYAVSSAFESHLTLQSEPLLSYIGNSAAPSGTTEGFENTFVKLFNDYRRGALSATLARVPSSPRSFAGEVETALETVAKAITVPIEVTERNTNISVYRQQEMLDYLVAKIKTKGVDTTIPLHPLSPPQDVRMNLLRIFKRIHNAFEKLPKSDKSHTFYCGLAVDWMRGQSFREIIGRRYDYKKTTLKRGKPSVPTVIREVFEDIEKELRFRYVKYMRCYIDVLRVALEQTGNSAYIAQIPAIPLYLELGACSDTTVSLIALGFTRTSAVEVGRLAPRPSLTSSEAARWLKAHNWASESLPWITRHELTTLGYHKA